MFNLKELASAVLAISTFAIASITNFNFFEESKIASNATSELTTANTATPIVDQSQSLKKESLTKPDEDQTKQQPKPLHISTNPDGTIKLQLNKKLIPTIKTPSLPSISIGEPASAGWITEVIKAYGVEKALDQCIGGGCEYLISEYGKTTLKRRVVNNESMYIMNNKISPARNKYHSQKQCVSDNEWMRIVYRS
jgi:hypothetical protein